MTLPSRPTEAPAPPRGTIRPEAAAAPPRDAGLAPRALFALALLPPLLLALSILEYGVDLPYADQWTNAAAVIEKYAGGDLRLSDFYAQHNESRTVFPRAIFLGLALLTGWDVRYETLLTFVAACLVALGVGALARRTVRVGPTGHGWLALITSIVVFGPIQHENWLWGIQLVVFIPIGCLIACLLLARSRLGATAQFLLAALLCTVATFSFSNGMLCWLAALPALAFSAPGSGILKRKRHVLGWLAGIGVTVLVYFHGFYKPPALSDPRFLVEHPLRAGRFLLSFLGAPLAFGTSEEPLVVAPIVGAALLILLCATCLALVSSSERASRLRDAVPWLSVVVYVLLNGVLATAGRAGLGPQQALASRYTTTGACLIVALVHLVALAARGSDRRVSGRMGISTRSACLLACLATILGLLHSLSSIHGLDHMRSARVARRQGKAILLLSKVLPREEALFAQVFSFRGPDRWSPERRERLRRRLLGRVDRLDEMGFFRPPLVRTRNLRDIQAGPEEASRTRGYFDEVTKGPGGRPRASGWAVRLGEKDPADAILLAYDDERGDPIAFAQANRRAPRTDIDLAMSERHGPLLGWKVDFDPGDLPVGARHLTAWAFDSTTGRVSRLSRAHEVSPSGF